ncbi:MAG: HNH endonuclease [Anaerotignum sp.]|nr:HNH endonuclease [Anaerotignum sp.]
MSERLNKEFGTSYKPDQIKGFYGNHHLSSGLAGHFEKGHTPYNKGKKGQCAAGCEKTWFKKGGTPGNHREVGEERVTIYGYLEVKVAEPNVWRAKHHVIWEQHHGPIPEKHVVIFRDRDKTNLSIDNLVLVHRAANAIMNQNGLGNCTDERLDLALQFAETKRAIAAAKRGRKKKKGMTKDA